jgi:hypothetical protein
MAQLQDAREKPMKIASFYQTDQRYLSLRIIGGLFYVTGAMLVAIGTLLLVFGLWALLPGMSVAPPWGADLIAAHQSRVTPIVVGFGGTFSLLWSFVILLSGLQSIALGTLFRLAINLEENTRASAQALDKIRLRLESREEGVGQFFRS